MNTIRQTKTTAADDFAGELFDLELRIARRADALILAETRLAEHPLECWLRAEAEVLADEAEMGQTLPADVERDKR